MRPTLVIVMLLMAATASANPMQYSARAHHRLGAGVHYLYNLGDIQDTGVSNLDLTEHSFGFIGSYQYNPGLIKFEADVEYILDYLGTDEGMFEPSAWGLVGGLLYAGAGIGIGYIDGDFLNDPWYALRAGVDIPLASLDLDVYGAYRFQQAGDLEGLGVDDLNSLTFAGIVRFGFGAK